MEEPGQPIAPSDRETFEEERGKRLHRNRLVGYSVCIALWLLAAVPLARLSSDEGGGVDVAAAYLAAGLGIAVVSRGIYARRTRRPFWSPWLFLIAAVLAILSYEVQSAGDKAFEPESRARPNDQARAAHSNAIASRPYAPDSSLARQAHRPSGTTE